MRRGLQFLSFFKNTTTTESKNIFHLPLQHLMPVDCITELQGYITTSRSCTILSTLLKQNIEYFTARHLQQLFKHLRVYSLPIDDTFHTIITPISLQYIKCFNRQHAYVFYNMAMTILELDIHNAELWNAINHKLDDENIYRYIPLGKVTKILGQMLDREDLRQSSLAKKLIQVVYQNGGYYKGFEEYYHDYRSVMQKIETFQGLDPKLTEKQQVIE